MAYNEFAYFYDEFNGEADYDALYGYITDELKAHGITDGILADLGCGTGDLTLMLTQAGYDVIGIDRSEEMLSVLREKADELGLTGRLLLLKQDLLDLDLYGTIRAAVSTFDTYSHIGPQENFEKAIRKAAYFMERGGVFIFDLNTPYKHRHILAGQTFDIEAEDADCHWSNRYDETAQTPWFSYTDAETSRQLLTAVLRNTSKPTREALSQVTTALSLNLQRRQTDCRETRLKSTRLRQTCSNFRLPSREQPDGTAPKGWNSSLNTAH